MSFLPDKPKMSNAEYKYRTTDRRYELNKLAKKGWTGVDKNLSLAENMNKYGYIAREIENPYDADKPYLDVLTSCNGLKEKVKPTLVNDFKLFRDVSIENLIVVLQDEIKAMKAQNFDIELPYPSFLNKYGVETVKDLFKNYSKYLIEVLMEKKVASFGMEYVTINEKYDKTLKTIDSL
jgi:hypothetical protein